MSKVRGFYKERAHESLLSNKHNTTSGGRLMERPKWLDQMEVAATKALDDILREIDEDNGPSMADIAESVSELDEEEMEK